MPLTLPSSRRTSRSSTKAMVAAWGATYPSSPRPMWAADPPRLFSTCARSNPVPCADPVSSTSRAAKGGGCSSGTGSASASAAGASASAGTGGLSIVASSYVSAASSASTWMEGGGCGVGAFLANGVPQSKQNFAAGGFSAPQFAQGFSAGKGTESTGATCFSRLGGGGAGGGRRAGAGELMKTAGETAPPACGRPVEGGGGAKPGTANGSGGVLSWGEPLPARAVVSPASAASSSEIASARSSWDMVSGVWEGGVNPEGGVWSVASCPASAPRGAPQLLQEACPGTLYASHRLQTSPSDPGAASNSRGASSSRSGARHRLHSEATSSFSLPHAGQVTMGARAYGPPGAWVNARTKGLKRALAQRVEAR